MGDEAHRVLLRKAAQLGLLRVITSRSFPQQDRQRKCQAAASRHRQLLDGTIDDECQLTGMINADARFRAVSSADRLSSHDPLLKTAWRDGTTHLVLSPLKFMHRLAALVPRPRLHLIRFHGVLAPNARLRALVVPREAEA